MTFDFKKEYKEFYMPKNTPEIVTVPKVNYIAVKGKGNPNEGAVFIRQLTVTVVCLAVAILVFFPVMR